MEFFHFIIHHKHLFKKLLVVKKFFHLEYCVLTILFFVCVIVYMDACLLIAVCGSVCACVCAHIRIFLKGENAFYPSVFFSKLRFEEEKARRYWEKKIPLKRSNTLSFMEQIQGVKHYFLLIITIIYKVNYLF
mmetsp:Transcript_9484/g.14120  ORF Transcript_9484/g.14120 Transcript_9484/m.14120 type:complete len:133 (+) Transcript_9484:130-528(+)